MKATQIDTLELINNESSRIDSNVMTCIVIIDDFCRATLVWSQIELLFNFYNILGFSGIKLNKIR